MLIFIKKYNVKNTLGCYITVIAFNFLIINNDLFAKGFEYTTEKVAMPENWLSKKISYDAQIKSADIVLSLGQQTHPALKRYVQAYAKKHHLKIVVQKGSCGVSAGKLRRKSVDIGAYCCPAGKSDRLPSLNFHSIGIASISIVVHPDNPLSNLSLLQARKIFQGSYSRWSDLSIKTGTLIQRKIQPVVRLHCKKRPGHWRALLKDEDQFSPRIYEVGVVPDMIKKVAVNPLAIGYETLYMLKVHQNNGALKSLSIDGVDPADLDKLAKGHYPFYRSYSLTTWSHAAKNQLALKLVNAIKKFIENNSQQFEIVPVSILKKNGWHFLGDELVASPDGTSLDTSLPMQ